MAAAATLAGTTGAVAAQTTDEGGADLTTVVDFEPANLPESLTFDSGGDLYFSLPASGSDVANVRSLPAARTDESGLTVEATEAVETLPGSPIGITLSPDGDALYAAVARGDDGTTGAYRVCLTGRPTVQVGSFGPFPNDPVVDPPNDRLLVTESFTGAVYAVPLDGGGASVWLDHPLLDPVSENGFGANGIAMRGREVYVANSSRGAVVRVPVGPRGEAGTPEVYAEDDRLVGADGIEFRGRTLYVAVNGQNAIRRVDRRGTVETVAEGGVLDFPSDVAFDGEDDDGDLFVANFATTSPTDGGGPRLLRTKVRGN